MLVPKFINAALKPEPDRPFRLPGNDDVNLLRKSSYADQSNHHWA